MVPCEGEEDAGQDWLPAWDYCCCWAEFQAVVGVADAADVADAVGVGAVAV